MQMGMVMPGALPAAMALSGRSRSLLDSAKSRVEGQWMNLGCWQEDEWNLGWQSEGHRRMLHVTWWGMLGACWECGCQWSCPKMRGQDHEAPCNVGNPCLEKDCLRV